MSQLRNDIDAFMRTNSDLLFNECELQIRLTNHLDNSGHYDKVYVEYAMPIKELHQRNPALLNGASFPWKSNLYVDIVVEKDGKFAAVELKYATYPVNHTITRFGVVRQSDYKESGRHRHQDVRLLERCTAHRGPASILSYLSRRHRIAGYKYRHILEWPKSRCQLCGIFHSSGQYCRTGRVELGTKNVS